MTVTSEILHATSVARYSKHGWRAILLRGPSGAGKSDLALRLLAAGWRLLADDRSVVWLSGGAVFARAPARLKCLIEVRGLGVVQAPTLGQARVLLVVDCIQERCELERMPDEETVKVLQAELSRVQVYTKEASAVEKVALALDRCERRFDSVRHVRM